MDRGGRKESSHVWLSEGGWFSKTTEKHEGKSIVSAVCEFVLTDGTTCGKLYQNPNTGHLSDHLKNNHNFTKEDWLQKKAASMRGGLSRHLVSGSIVLDFEELRDQRSLLGIACANQLLPLSVFEKKKPSRINSSGEDIMVERWDLASWLHNLLPQFTPPSYNTLKDYTLKEVEQRLDVDVRFLLSRMFGVGNTTDGWSSDGNLKLHCLTAHGILRHLDGSLLYLSFSLGMKHLTKGDATAVADFVEERWEYWKLNPRQISVVGVDGGDRAMASILHQKHNILWWHCPCHWINLGVHDVTEWPISRGVKVELAALGNYPNFIRQVWELINKCKQVVSYFGTAKNWDALQKCHEQNFAAKGKLKTFKQDVKTRWTSEFDCMSSVFDSMETQVQYWKEKREQGVLSSGEYKMVEECIYVLSIAKTVSTRLQTWDFPSGVDIWPHLFRCVEFWEKFCTNEVIKSALVREFRDKLLDRISKRAAEFFKACPKLHLAMMAFNPYFWQTQHHRSKISDLWNQCGIHFACMFETQVTGGDFVDLLKKELMSCVNQFAPATLAACCDGAYVRSSDGSASISATGGEPLSKRWKEDNASLFVPPSVSHEGESGFTHPANVEVGLFIDALSKDTETNILRLYSNYLAAKKYPRCLHVGLRFLGVSGSNSPSEVLWNDADIVFNDKRSNTGEEWGDCQVKLHRNFDTVKKIREMVECRPGETLEDAWNRKKK